ncbi:histone H4 transcription factor-like [Pollicipes pollicipes]|uniref:histone H4 transcription factor-like n=1 Tax=Pollicipes pollicipes TaxID=41117 RepID=UPI0018850EB0|nr:histone H4 transcription factor-like [Pollicipes pollicipes]
MPFRIRKRAPPGADDEEKPPSAESRRPRPHKLIGIRRTKEKLHLKCGWDGCKYSSKKMELFNSHVGEHVPVLSADGSDYVRCRWEDCDHYSSDQRELRRHILYHAFHRKVTAIARNVQRRNDMLPCQLASGELHVMPELSDPFRCLWDGCDTEFDDPQAYYWHVEHHIDCYYERSAKDNSQASLKCLWQDCSLTVAIQYRLKEHVRTHSQEKWAACPKCGNLFSCNQKFFDHCIRQVPVEDMQYQCSHCLKRFATERLLRNHIRNHINNYRCTVCGMTCPSPGSLNKHIAFRHSEAASFACSICSRGFKTDWDRNKHELTHDPSRRTYCPTCPYSTVEPSRLKIHMKTKHTGVPRSWYRCHLCDAKYGKGLTLTQHLKRRHHLAVPQGHVRFNYKRDKDGQYRLQTLRYESLDVAEQVLGGPAEPAGAGAASAEPDVLALTCGEGEVPDTITTDDGRELRLPERVRVALGTGARVLVCVTGEQVQLLALTDASQEMDDPDDPDSVMMVVEGGTAPPAAAAGPAAAH